MINNSRIVFGLAWSLKGTAEHNRNNIYTCIQANAKVFRGVISVVREMKLFLVMKQSFNVYTQNAWNDYL